MNLDFKTLETIHNGAGTFQRQRAKIPPGKDSSTFWRTWRQSKEELKKFFQVGRENNQWYIYRLYPVTQDGKYGTFKTPYMLKFTHKLLPYQHEPVRVITAAILDNVCACDGSDTGLGKTYVALAVCRELQVRPGVICKKAGIAGWKRACRYMEIEPAFIINYEALKTGKYQYVRRETYYMDRVTYKDGMRETKRVKRFRFEWYVPEKTLLIFDEQHVCNHLRSQNNIMYMAARPYPSLSVSATFADRSYNMYSLLSTLKIMPNFEAFRNYLTERGMYTNCYRGNDMLSEKEVLQDINALIYPRRGYRMDYYHPDVKKYFPDAVYIADAVNIDNKKTAELNNLYSEIREKINEYKHKGKQAAAMTADLRYRQAAELAKAPVLVEYANQHLFEGKSVCIFVNFRDTLAFLMKQLNTKSAIFGDQSRYGIEREQVINDFLGNVTRLIICMIQAGGQSIDLHDINGSYQRVSLICPSNNSIEFKQVLGRTHRAGSKSTPIIKLIYTAGTIEEKVADRIREKLNNINALNDSDFSFFE